MSEEVSTDAGSIWAGASRSLEAIWSLVTEQPVAVAAAAAAALANPLTVLDLAAGAATGGPPPLHDAAETAIQKARELWDGFTAALPSLPPGPWWLWAAGGLVLLGGGAAVVLVVLK